MFEKPSRENGRREAESARISRRRPRLNLAPGFVLAWLIGGCALSDPYFVDPNYGQTGAGGAPSGGTGSGGIAQGGSSFGGAANGGEAAGSSLGGLSGLGGTESSGGAGGAATGGESGCGSDCNGVCCGTECVDLRSDAGHCGSCDVACNAGRTCTAGVCSSGWVTSANPPPTFVGRERAAHATMGDKIFIWGGVDKNNNALDDGAIYDPVNDVWSLISTDPQTPSPRQLATAVWTGKAVLVFGGRNATSTTYYRDAALYDPVADSWSPAGNAPAPRASGAGGATPTTVAFYGGLTTGGGGLQGTTRYSIATNTWPTTSLMGAPEALIGIATGFTDTSLFSFGGQRGVNMRTNQGYRYDIVADSWTPLPAMLGAVGRAFAFGVSDGTNFFVWAGRDDLNLRSDGAVFGEAWTSFDKTKAPSARAVAPRQSGWAFALAPGVAAFLGGLDNAGKVMKNGGVYDTAKGWSDVPGWPSDEDHEWAVAARAGGELFLWSGHDDSGATTTGERWAAP